MDIVYLHENMYENDHCCQMVIAVHLTRLVWLSRSLHSDQYFRNRFHHHLEVHSLVHVVSFRVSVALQRVCTVVRSMDRNDRCLHH